LIQRKLKDNKTVADFRLDVNGNQIKIYVSE